MEFAAGKVENLRNKISAFKQDKWWSISILFVVMLGVFVRLRLYFANNSLWMDEAALANNLLLPNSILDNMTYLQAAPPLFKLFSLINVKCFGMIEYAFRLLPLLAGILAIFFFYEIVKQVFAKKVDSISSNVFILFKYFFNILCRRV